MLIAREHFTEDNAPDVVARIGADILIASEGDEAKPERWISLLRKAPNLKVLVLEKSGRTAMLYELRPHRIALGEVSKSGLVDAIRAATRNEVA